MLTAAIMAIVALFIILLPICVAISFLLMKAFLVLLTINKRSLSAWISHLWQAEDQAITASGRIDGAPQKMATTDTARQGTDVEEPRTREQGVAYTFIGSCLLVGGLLLPPLRGLKLATVISAMAPIIGGILLVYGISLLISTAKRER